ncbi:MAG: RnfABCDGE type electron transport complex subunit D [Bacteroidales bacterium]|nr:MAG: RnfABCDGE type electron transport complex subunit D [Bacteroidales bacterium]
MDKLLTVAPSPHIYGEESIRKLMLGVIIALLPALFCSVYFFGWGAVIISVVAVTTCIITEYLIQKFLLKGELSITDGSAIITGLLLAFNLPGNLPVGIVIIGSVVSIGIGKMTFGGLGRNPFNPALIGRVFLLVSFPVQMTSWPVPQGFMTSYTDAVTGATPLEIVKEGLRNGEQVSELMDRVPGYLQLFYGHSGGSLGETAAIALLLGLAYMLIKKIITWHIPVSIIMTISLFTGILWLINPQQNADPLFHILTGGVLLGAIFMATDYVTSPMTRKGMWIYGIGIGIITVLIRIWGAYPEGISYAILIMNAFVPLINRYIKPRLFGKEGRYGKD